MPDHHEYCTGGYAPDDVVITGISGRFPACNSLEEFKEAMLTQKKLLFETNERHEKGAEELPFGSPGTISDIDKFDREYFGYSSKLANAMEPTHRVILELSSEAIADAGYDPTIEMKRANIGVYTAISNEDGKDLRSPIGLRSVPVVSGYLRSMAANRCSHHFDFIGPSFTIDSACSTSFTALWTAYWDIKEGRVDAALVNGGQLCLNPALTKMYVNTGIVSPTCECRPFDIDANGIVRTEAICAIFIQKASAARRVYATINHIEHHATGHVPEGIAVPSFKQEVVLFNNVLKASGITPKDIQYIEAHGTGTPVGDPIETKAIETVYCEGRTPDDPLWIGSVKSNVGHAEAAAGVTGAIKTLLAFETGVIPPNYGFITPNPKCEPLVSGIVKVLTEPLPLKTDYIAVNCFGFGGSILQAMLKRNPITYSDVPEPEDLPRLLLYPATTEAAVQYVFDYVKNHPELRSEFFALLNKLSFTPTLMKPYRGFALFQDGNSATQTKHCQREKKREVWYVMTGMGCQWPGMGMEMMQIKAFADSMNKSASVLKPFGLDLFEILKKDSNHLLTDRKITTAFVAIAAIQIALVDLLKVLEIEPDGIIGHSTGELICAYADGCCTAEQTILSAYYRGVAVETANLATGSMAAVGLTWEEATKRCPEEVYPACHNAEDSVTISGLKEPVEKFVSELQKEDVFARVVNAYSYAFHCKHVWPASDKLRKVLSEIIRDPKPRTERWVSTSYPEDEWEKECCKMAGPEYFVHNLMSPVRFRDALQRIPHDAITIEIGPHFLLQSILKRSIGSDARYIGLMKRNDENNVGFFLESIGKAYLEGLDPKIENLYKPVQFPVPRGTPIISDLIQWDHSQSYFVPKWRFKSSSYVQALNFETSDGYMLDHFIDGRALFPATGYVWLAWQALAKKTMANSEDINIIVEDFKIHRPVVITPTMFTFSVAILDNSGRFEISAENNSLVASGKIYDEDNVFFCEPPPTINKDPSTVVSGEDIYAELRIQGYEYGPAFRRLVETTVDGKYGYVEWKDSWIPFLDALLLFYMNSADKSSFLLPTGALNFKICPKVLMESVEACAKENLPGIPVNFYADSQICRTAGVEIKRLELDSAPQHIKPDNCIFEEYKFVPYIHKYTPVSKDNRLEKYMIACNKIIETLEDNIETDLTGGKFSVKTKVDFDVDEYINDGVNEKKLLTALKDMVSIEDTTDVLQESKRIFSKFIQEIGKDLLNTLFMDEYCLRLLFDIISENSYRKLSVLEVNTKFPPVLPMIVDAVERYSMLKFKSRTFACEDVEKVDKNKMSDFKINVCSSSSLSTTVQEKSQNVVIGTICVSTIEEGREHFRLISSFVETKGFLLLFHKNIIQPPENLLASLSGGVISIIPQAVIESWFAEEELVIVSKISNEISGSLYLLRRRNVPAESQKIIRLSENPAWLDELKTSVSKETEITWVVSDDCPSSGIIGMVNCLKNEPGGDTIRCVFIPERNKEKDAPPQFNFNHPFYSDVIDKDLVVNVYKEKSWGSFRHIRIEKELPDVEIDRSHITIKRYGDLSSLYWVESSLSYNCKSDRHIIEIYYSALNFRDIMLATGKLSTQTAKGLDKEYKDCLIGIEFAGRNKHGERIMGLCRSAGLATSCHTIPEVTIPVPNDWSLEEAATVPVVYCTCYYALILRGRVQPGESILIHSGTGGVGLAAINIALSMNCEVFTTVGTEKKRKYLLENYPTIKSENIGCSRDTTFESMIMKRTNGRGVDVVLNSLAGDKFYASVRCVATHGRFLEIGKYDMAMDNKLGLKFFLKNISFHAVYLDQIVMDKRMDMMHQLNQMIVDGIKRGVVKPLHRTVFQRDETEKAFRYMGGGTHIGKVLLKIRDEEKQKLFIPSVLRIPAKPVTYFYPHKVYIIVGGLGGFGIEVSKWLLQKGARKLVLTTRYGARTSYHHLCLRRWKDEGYNVIVSKRNVSIKEEASKLLREVAEIGPVGGIFNSAVVLQDAFLENTNFESFKEVCAPKADATRNLDVLSRCFCPELDHFVCFSSISCGRGNAGQMNYGYANSVMERICEQRRKDGFPGLSIQWGIIGEVGVVHRHMGDDAMIAGVSAQRVRSCLNILDVSCQMKSPVVCSYVAKDFSAKGGDRGDTLQQLARIFGFKDPSEFNAVRSFGEMGVDSIIGIEVKHLLETACDVTFTMKEIQELKVEDVRSLLEKVQSQKMKTISSALVSTTSVKLPKSSVHPNAVERLNDIEKGVPVFFIDIDCDDIAQLKKLGTIIQLPAYGLLMSHEVPTKDVETLASWYLEKIMSLAEKEAHIVARSSASVLAVEMALQIQRSGKPLSITVTTLGGYDYLLKVTNKDSKPSEVDLLLEFVEDYAPSASIALKEKFQDLTSFDQHVRAVVDYFTKCSSKAVNKSEMTEIITSNVKKLQLLEEYSAKEKLAKDLLVVEDSTKLLANDVAEAKLQLAEICSGKVTIQRIPDMNSYSEDSIKRIDSVLKSVFG